MEKNVTPFEKFEKEVMDKLLENDRPSKRILKQQYEKSNVESRWFSGKGFFTSFSIAEDAPKIESPKSLQIDEVGGKINNIDVGFILFIEDGKIKTLEGFTYGDDHWPDKIIRYELFSETYNQK